MKPLQGLLLVFAISYFGVTYAPARLGQPLSFFGFINQFEVVDLFAPLILLPLYWLILQKGGEGTPSQAENFAFIPLAVLWVQGQAMHLAANNIHRFTSSLPGSAVDYIAAFYDETLSHYWWVFGIIGLSALLIYRQWRKPFQGQSFSWWPQALAAGLYGLVFFVYSVEAGVVRLSLPYALAVAVFGLVAGRKSLPRQPVLAFFLLAALLALALFAAWGAYWGGFPQITETGLLRD